MMGEDAKLAGQREYRRNLQTLEEFKCIKE